MEIKNIYASINEAMKKIWVVGKDKNNTQWSWYKYRWIDDVVASCSSVMQEFWLILTSEIISSEREERVSKSWGTLIYTIIRYKFYLYALDWSFVSTEKQGEAMDSWDKWSNKAYASAEKYALCELFMIPTYSNDDTENETHEVEAKTKTVQDVSFWIPVFTELEFLSLVRTIREKWIDEAKKQYISFKESHEISDKMFTDIKDLFKKHTNDVK